MGDMGEVFNAHKKRDKRRRSRNLAHAEQVDDGRWAKHTEHHWTTTLNGERLHYWPSRNKFMHRGKVMCGDVHGYIRNREN
jgi:hypothetical protein